MKSFCYIPGMDKLNNHTLIMKQIKEKSYKILKHLIYKDIKPLLRYCFVYNAYIHVN